MRKNPTKGLVAASILLAACQFDTYKIEGHGDDLKEGDTIFLSKAIYDSLPFDTAIVHDGQFSFEGFTDSTQLSIISCTNARTPSLYFLLEPGRIKIHLSGNPMRTHIGGTANNRKWQSLMEDGMPIGIKIEHLSTLIDNDEVCHNDRKELIDSIQSLNSKFAEILESYVRKNIDNEFGCFVLKYYTEFFDRERLSSLINDMPEKFHNRKDILQLQAEKD